jgi:hypothetical protein
MTEPASPPAAPADPLAGIDTYMLAVAINAVIANRRITADQAAAEMGVGAEKVSALRRRGELTPGIALRIIAWLNLSPRYFQTDDSREATVIRVRIPADAAPADEAPPRAAQVA